MYINIRDTAGDDIPDIKAIENSCFSVPWTLEMLENQLESKGHIFLAAECEGALAGYMGLQYVLDEGYITNVATDHRFRKQGIASSLIKEMIFRAQNLELAFLTLEVRESNTPARLLYGKHGFKDVGRRRHYYENPVEDAILMTLYLK